MKIQAKALAEAAALAARVTQYVDVDASTEACVLRSRSATCSLRQFVACEDPITFRVDAKDLARAAATLGGELAIKREGTAIVVRSGKRRATVQTLEPLEVEPLSATPKRTRIDVDAFRTATQRVADAALHDGSGRTIESVVLEIDSNGLSAWATDGHRAHLYGSKRETQAALPTPMFALVRALLPQTSTLSLGASDKTIRIEGDGWEVAHVAHAHALPNVHGIVPSARVTEAVVSRDACLAELKVLAGLGCVLVRLEFAAGGMRCASDGSECEVAAEIRGKAPARVGVNLSYLIDAVRSAPEGDVVVALSGSDLEPLVVEYTDGLAVVMPVRL